NSNDGPPPPFPTLFPPPNVRYSSGKIGVSFASSFTVEDAPSLRLTTGLTIEAWVYLYASNFDYTNRIILSKWGLPLDVSYLFGCTNRSLYLQVSPSGSPNDSVTLFSAQRLPLTNWIHVAGTYDGAELRIYTNGTLVASSTYSLGIHPGLANVGIGRVPVNPGVTATT